MDPIDFWYLGKSEREWSNLHKRRLRFSDRYELKGHGSILVRRYGRKYPVTIEPYFSFPAEIQDVSLRDDAIPGMLIGANPLFVDVLVDGDTYTVWYGMKNHSDYPSGVPQFMPDVPNELIQANPNFVNYRVAGIEKTILFSSMGARRCDLPAMLAHSVSSG